MFQSTTQEQVKSANSTLLRTTLRSVVFPMLMALGMVIGTSAYFLLLQEPDFDGFLKLAGLLVVLLLMSGVIFKFLHRGKLNNTLPLWAWLGIAFVSWVLIGFGVVTYQVQVNNPNMLAEKYSGQRFWVVGQVTDINQWQKKSRLVLEHLKIYGIPKDETPQKVRISTHTKRLQKLDISTGHWLAVEAVLNTPNSNPKTRWESGYLLKEHSTDATINLVVSEKKYNKILKGTSAYNASVFDFRRYAWLQGVGATGYVRGEIYSTSSQREQEDSLTWWNKASVEINRWRRAVHERINDDLRGGEVGGASYSYREGQGAGIASALLTGIRDGISFEDKDNFRKSGLSHVLAISGMHLGLIAGIVFFGFRRLIGFSPSVIMRINTKKISAVVALLITFVYMLLAGTTIPTVRAFIMLSLLFLAVLLERKRIALRVLFMAVVIVLLIWPESVITPSFQMSFAAALILSIWADFAVDGGGFKGTLSGGVTRFGTLFKGVNYFKGVAVTSLCAGLATLPIAAWHFGTVSLIGVLINLGAIPITAFWIMPSGLLGLLAMSLANAFSYIDILLIVQAFEWVEQMSFKVMGYGVEELILLAGYGAGLPFAGVEVSLPWEWLCVLVVFLLIVLLMRWWKVFWVGLFVSLVGTFVFGSLSNVNSARSDVFVLNSGKDVLLKIVDSDIADGGNGDKIETRFVSVRENRKRYNKRSVKKFLERNKIQLSRDKDVGSCDDQGCVYEMRHDQKVLVMHNDAIPSQEDCQQVELVIGNRGEVTMSMSELILKYCSNYLAMSEELISAQISFTEIGGENETIVNRELVVKGERRVWE